MSGPSLSWWEGRPTGHGRRYLDTDGRGQDRMETSRVSSYRWFVTLVSSVRHRWFLPLSVASARTPATNDRLFHSSRLTFLQSSSLPGRPVVPRTPLLFFRLFVCLLNYEQTRLRCVKLRSLVDAPLTRVLKCWLTFHISPCQLHCRVGLLASSGRARVTALRAQASVTWCDLVQVAYILALEVFNCRHWNCHVSRVSQ